MHYEGDIYRPPSEAYSILIQATIGCTWNRCKFCTMYKSKKFRVRKMDEIRRDLEEFAAHRNRDRFQKIFLCDGDAFALSAAKLLEILGMIRELFPHLQGVRAYARSRDVLNKTPEELRQIREMGLDMVYIGLETGNDKLLKEYNKGETSEDMINAAKLLKQAGIKQSISIIAGLGGKTYWREHMRDTAKVLNAMQPEYLGLLVLTPGSDNVLTVEDGYEEIEVPSAKQVLQEMKLLLEGLEVEGCYFTSAHVSNYIYVKGALLQDRPALIEQVDRLLLQMDRKAFS